MKPMTKIFLLALLPAALLSACGGGDDLADRLDVADPVVRFIDASPVAPNLTLFKGTLAQSDATNVGYGFASNYFDISTDTAVWSTNTTTGNVSIGNVTINPVRGDRYTIVALATSATASGTLTIIDPYNKPLGSSSTHVRIVNASFTTANIDTYVTAVGADITPATVTPTIAGTAFDTAGPPSGSDSVDLPAGTYQVTITTAATKTVLFKGELMVGTNQDVLLLTVPSTTAPGTINTLVKVEGTAGASPLPPL